jgi:hypothetical protein
LRNQRLRVARLLLKAVTSTQSPSATWLSRQQARQARAKQMRDTAEGDQLFMSPMEAAGEGSRGGSR